MKREEKNRNENGWVNQRMKSIKKNNERWEMKERELKKKKRKVDTKHKEEKKGNE